MWIAAHAPQKSLLYSRKWVQAQGRSGRTGSESSSVTKSGANLHLGEQSAATDFPAVSCVLSSGTCNPFVTHILKVTVTNSHLGPRSSVCEAGTRCMLVMIILLMSIFCVLLQFESWCYRSLNEGASHFITRPLDSAVLPRPQKWIGSTIIYHILFPFIRLRGARELSEEKKKKTISLCDNIFQTDTPLHCNVQMIG